nr:MAG TPA: hypothetical protein [Caudoviricetes sp.]
MACSICRSLGCLGTSNKRARPGGNKKRYKHRVRCWHQKCNKC